MPGQFDNRKKKAAAEQVVYEIDWSTALRDGDTIATSTWAFVTPSSGLTKDNEDISLAATKTYVRVKEGTVGGPYQLRNTVVTTVAPVETLVEDLFVTVE
jgi:hypothetical protein